MIAAPGPSRIARSAPPTGWTVVPPAIGMLNIMMVKQNAAPIARVGACREPRVARSLLPATAQTGVIAAAAAREVAGLMAESGMCKGASVEVAACGIVAHPALIRQTRSVAGFTHHASLIRCQVQFAHYGV